MNSPSLKDKVPPHNSEAEAATLGAMLLDPEAVGIVLRHLRPEDFYSGYNRNIYSAILSLFNKGQEVDLITLTDELRATGKLEASGGRPMLQPLPQWFRPVRTSNTMRKLSRILVSVARF